jgi:hypothetical protein
MWGTSAEGQVPGERRSVLRSEYARGCGRGAGAGDGIGGLPW